MRQLGSNIVIPKGHGDKARLPNWKSSIVVSTGVAQLSSGALVTSVGFLTEGSTPNATPMSAASITGAVTAFGGAKGYTDRVVTVSMASVLEPALNELARELAFKIDRYTRAKVSANALKVNARSVTMAAPNDNKVPGANVLFGKNIAMIAPLMESQMLPTWDNGSFVAVAHPLARFDVLRDISSTGFVPVASYNNARRVFRGEIGEFYGIRWLFSNAIPRKLEGGATSATTGLSGTVSGAWTYVFSPNSFYTLELQTGGVEVIHQPLGSAGSADSLGQRGTIGVKVNFGIIPTPSAERRIVRLVHATTLNGIL